MSQFAFFRDKRGAGSISGTKRTAGQAQGSPRARFYKIGYANWRNFSGDAAIPTTANTNDHSDPGTFRDPIVVNNPIAPLISKSHPTNAETAKLTTIGTTNPSKPSATSSAPSSTTKIR